MYGSGFLIAEIMLKLLNRAVVVLTQADLLAVLHSAISSTTTFLFHLAFYYAPWVSARELGLFQDVAWYKSVFIKRLSVNYTESLVWLLVVGCGGIFLFVGLLLFLSILVFCLF